jgi:hypothetical protein
MPNLIERLLLMPVLLAALPTMAEPVTQGEDGRGPYEGIAASENTVWVLDTRTGKVSKCVQDFADQPPKCSAFSK